MDLSQALRVTHTVMHQITNDSLGSKINSTYLSISLIIQIIFLAIFIQIFATSLYRVKKQIFNPYFDGYSTQISMLFNQEQDHYTSNMQEIRSPNVQHNQQNVVVFKFDEESQDCQNIHGLEQQQKRNKIDIEQQLRDKVNLNKQNKTNKSEEIGLDTRKEEQAQHQLRIKQFLNMQNRVLFLLPFLVGYILAITAFKAGFISLIALISTIAIYLALNISGVCSHIQWVSLIFMAPVILSYGILVI